MSLFASQADAKLKIQTLLDENDRAVLRAMVVIFEAQTASEQSCNFTHDANGVGYSAVHAEIMSSFAKQFEKKKFLSPKQLVIARKIVRKYWRQLAAVAEQKAMNKGTV
jgi:hypothetical protein